MNRARIRWLLVLMFALIVVRILVPNAPARDVAVSEAVVQAAKPAFLAVPVALPSAQALDLSTAIDIPGNAFAVRRPPAITPPPAPPQPPVVTAFAGPPVPPPPVVEPPPPPPPFNVIGTWDDGTAPGVFVSTPYGIQLVRKGTVLMAEYRVTAVTAQQLAIEHVTSKREYRLNVPRVAGK